MSRWAPIVLACAAASVVPVTPALAQDAGTETADAEAPARPRHLNTMREELRALDLDARCKRVTATRARCTFARRGTHSKHEHRFTIVSSEETSTVYAYAERYLTAPAGDSSTLQLLRRLMELNWELLVGKLEWNPSDGEVRLSAAMPAGAQLDRDAFRSLVRTLIDEADRHWPALARAAGKTPNPAQ